MWERVSREQKTIMQQRELMKKNIRKKQGNAGGGRRKQLRILPSKWMGPALLQQRGTGDLIKAWGMTVRRRQEAKGMRPRSRDGADACEATRGRWERPGVTRAEELQVQTGKGRERDRPGLVGGLD